MVLKRDGGRRGKLSVAIDNGNYVLGSTCFQQEIANMLSRRVGKGKTALTKTANERSSISISRRHKANSIWLKIYIGYRVRQYALHITQCQPQ
jgi:hypothetical protein